MVHVTSWIVHDVIFPEDSERKSVDQEVLFHKEIISPESAVFCCCVWVFGNLTKTATPIPTRRRIMIMSNGFLIDILLDMKKDWLYST